MDLFLPINYRRIVYFLRLADGALCVGVGLRLPPDLDDQMSGWLIEVCNNDPFSQFPCGKTTTCQDRLGKTHQDSLKTGSFLTHAGFFTGQHSDRRADGHHGRIRSCAGTISSIVIKASISTPVGWVSEPSLSCQLFSGTDSPQKRCVRNRIKLCTRRSGTLSTEICFFCNEHVHNFP
jgi:hypothetical protein